MKWNIKRLLSLVLTLAAVLTLLPVGTLAADMTTVYCQTPEDWDRCLVYWWGVGDHPQWPGVSMELDENGVWGCDVPTDAQGLIFNDGQGNQSGNLTVPTGDRVMYGYEQQAWTGYGETEYEALYIVAGSGSLCGSDWNPADENNRMTDPEGDGIFTKSYANVAAGTYELKVTVGSWSKSWGDPEKGSNYILILDRDVEVLTVCFDVTRELILIALDQEELPSPEPVITLSGSSNADTVTLTGNGLAETIRITDGYLFENLTPGSYTLTFRKEGFVERSVQVQVADQSVTQDCRLCLRGDVNGDGIVNIGDVARLYSHARKNAPLTGYALECGDYLADGVVNVGDVARMYSVIRGTAEPPEDPTEPEEPTEPEPTEPEPTEPEPTEPEPTEPEPTEPEPTEPEPTEPSGPQDPINGVYVVGRDELPYTDEEIYQQLFDPNSKLQIDLDMSDKELQKLQDDYERYRNMGSKSPIYRLGTMTITVTTARGTVSYQIPEVGVRMKGNTSRTSFYNQEEGIYKYIHFKFDFQETFDDEEYYGSDSKVWESEDARDARKDRTFATLEKLEMRWNKLYDSTYLRESYAYEVYRSEGVLAPQCNIGALTWSGKRMGIYTVEEPVDKLFIERNVPAEDQGGDLYKLGWTSDGATFTNTNSIGVEDEDKCQFFVYDLKTNKKKSTHDALKNMINTLNSGSVTKESFAGVVDVDNFLRFAAVSYFMGNPDDLRNNYNNCYVYFLKSSGKAVFIPYDYDRCLGINREYNPNGNSMTRDDPYGNGNQRSPLYRYSVDKGGYYTEEYTQVLLQVAENQLLTPEAFEARFNTAASLYRDLVTPERNLRNAEGRDFSFDLNRGGSASGGDNMSFKDYITAKMDAFRGFMGQTGGGDIDTARCYIRGDFNSWSIEEGYAMTREGDWMVYILDVWGTAKLKVYNDRNQTWMGTECLSPDTWVPYESDGHYNIILTTGTYRIQYSPEQNLITLDQQGSYT